MTDPVPIHAPQTTLGASRSLKALYNGPDDVIGLIAYGLFKVEQTEWAEANHPSSDEVNKYHQTLQSMRVKSLRANAENMLTDWIETQQQEWRDQYREELEALVDAKHLREISDTITKDVNASVLGAIKTSFWRDILTNVLGWVVSLAIVTLVALSVYGPTIPDLIKKILPPST